MSNKVNMCHEWVGSRVQQINRDTQKHTVTHTHTNAQRKLQLTQQK